MKKVFVFLLLIAFTVFAPAAHAVLLPATITLTETDNIDPVLSTGVEVIYDFSFNANTLTVAINNNSSTNYAPAITGIGFSLSEFTGQTIDAWDLMASPQDLSGPVSIKPNWSFETTDPNPDVTKFEFNYLTDTDNGANYGLYNPLVIPFDIDTNDPTLGSNPYFTGAVLTVTFSGSFSEILNAGARLQNVGADGDASRKLYGVPGDVPGIPEPATMFLLGAGLVGIAGMSRKKFKE